MLSAVSAGVPPAVVSARGVVKRYGRTVALGGLDAEIGPGITGLLGSNGAGKTTFILLVLGLRARDGGELTVLGRDPATAGIDVRARIGYAPEHHDLPAELSAADFVRHLGEMHLLPRRAAVQRRTTRSGSSGSARSAFGRSGRCRRASASASSLPRRSPTTPSSCSSTSRPTASTRCSGRRCSP